MSEHFVKTFNKRNACAHCKASKLRIGKHVYSLCESHLDKAREQWRSWSEQRRIDGKCCYCDKASFNGWLRCKLHTQYNREKCKRWMAANVEYVAQKCKERRNYWVNQGRCICSAHNKLDGNFTRCSPCRVKHAALNRTGRPVGRPRKLVAAPPPRRKVRVVHPLAYRDAIAERIRQRAAKRMERS